MFELAMVNEPSVFELVRIDCIWKEYAPSGIKFFSYRLDPFLNEDKNNLD